LVRALFKGSYHGTDGCKDGAVKERIADNDNGNKTDPTNRAKPEDVAGAKPKGQVINETVERVQIDPFERHQNGRESDTGGRSHQTESAYQSNNSFRVHVTCLLRFGGMEGLRLGAVVAGGNVYIDGAGERQFLLRGLG
jgi:hypothetical protein